MAILLFPGGSDGEIPAMEPGHRGNSGTPVFSLLFLCVLDSIETGKMQKKFCCALPQAA
jgi:hypothetical protein